MESEIIELFKNRIKRRINIGDDAGYFYSDKTGEWVVIANDMLISSTDIPDILGAEDVGFKIVTMNVSDVVAMGAKPTHFSFSIGFPKYTDLDYLERIANGIDEALKEYDMFLIAADTNEALELIIDGIAIGFSKRLLLRDNAKVGDLVCITGDVGRVLAALILYKRGEIESYPELLKKLCKPFARVYEGITLSKFANSAIDVSDGISKELNAIARASNVRIVIDAKKIPIENVVFEVSEYLKLDPIDIALSSGEEFELLFTIPAKLIHKLNFDFNVIGRVERGDGVYLERNGEMSIISETGWEHFSDMYRDMINSNKN